MGGGSRFSVVDNLPFTYVKTESSWSRFRIRNFEKQLTQLASSAWPNFVTMKAAKAVQQALRSSSASAWKQSQQQQKQQQQKKKTKSSKQTENEAQVATSTAAVAKQTQAELEQLPSDSIAHEYVARSKQSKRSAQHRRKVLNREPSQDVLALTTRQASASGDATTSYYSYSYAYGNYANQAQYSYVKRALS